MYLPLVAFDSKVNGKYDPEAFMAARQNLPNSVQEKALIEFWHKVGVDYHRTATVKDPTNNGHRPISLSDMEERIRSRALTLIGGGINNSWGPSSNAAAGTLNTKATTKAPRLSRKQQLAYKRQRKNKHLMHFTTNDEDGKMSRFLSDLNSLWNEYMVKLLQLPSSGDYHVLVQDSTVWSHVTASITNETAQLVGAQVRIKSCRESPNWVGKIGIVVGRTKNTWNVMVEGPVGKGKGKRENQSKSKLNELTTDKGNWKGWRSLVVPKRGSEITLLVPMKQKKSDGGQTLQSHHTAMTSQSRTPVLAIDINEDE